MLMPVRRVRRAARLADERLEALFGARIREVVEPVYVERGDDPLDVLLRADASCLARVLHHARHGRYHTQMRARPLHFNLDTPRKPVLLGNEVR